MKTWVHLLLCLLLSAGIWLIHNLSLSYVDVVSVPVVAESNLVGRTRVSSTEATVTARVKSSGFHLAALSRPGRHAVEVFIDPSDFKHVKGDTYAVSASKLHKYGTEIFGPVESVESFLVESVEFSFPSSNNRKVPVKQVQDVTFEEQYTATGPMTVKPDSVIIYGEQSRLDNISYVLTKPISLKELRNTAHGTVKLEIPAGVRASATEVNYTLEVSRYVEISAEVNIGMKNVPAGVEMAVMPSVATVVFRCVFPTTSSPAEDCEFYVDYQDFAGSLTGRCIAKCDNLPSGVIDYRMDPEVFDCVVVTE